MARQASMHQLNPTALFPANLHSILLAVFFFFFFYLLTFCRLASIPRIILKCVSLEMGYLSFSALLKEP